MSGPITPEHVYHLRTVSDPALCPDGSRLAYTQSWVDQESLDSRSRIMVLETATGLSNEFTQGVKDTAPKYSPDGRQLAFLRPDGTGKRQVWVIGTTGGEARPLAVVPVPDVKPPCKTWPDHLVRPLFWFHDGELTIGAGPT